jgi:hypothetical protein
VIIERVRVVSSSPTPGSSAASASAATPANTARKPGDPGGSPSAITLRPKRRAQLGDRSGHGDARKVELRARATRKVRDFKAFRASTRFEPTTLPWSRGADLLARLVHVGHAEDVVASGSATPIPQARFDDLDLDREEDRVEWRRRLAELATARLTSARARFQHLGIVDTDGKLISTELPPDMLPDSDTTLETG